MATTPTPTPVTTPVDKPTLAVPELALVHVPPPVASASVMVLPLMDTLDGPAIAATAGSGLTVTVIVADQQSVVYVIVALTGEIPVTVPLPVPRVAIAVLLLFHVPPPVASVSVEVVPGHSNGLPPIAAGGPLTVTTNIAAQPVAVIV